MSIETMTKLATVTVGAGGSTYVEFTNIPQTYTDLKIHLSARTTKSSAWDELKLSFNPPNSNYLETLLYGDGASAGSVAATSNRRFIICCGDTATSNTFGSAEQYIFNYTNSAYKATSIDSVNETNGTTAYQYLDAILWQDTAPITSIRLESNNSASFKQYTTATLYGIRNARRTVGNSIKATDGNISFDGTYVVHTFTSSGTFTPTTGLVADYLVVAGGGGGGNNHGGGGGAGGLRSTVTATGGGGSLESKLSLIPNNIYTVTVGAGGAANVSGNNSSLATITSIGGGRGTEGGSQLGYTGGSGGGAGGSGNDGGFIGTGGLGTANQGYAGGNTVYVANNRTGAGGGGAGAVGSNGLDSVGGNGGNGVATSISGSSITYAGGGGGGVRNTTGTVGSGGTGGGGAGSRMSGPGTGVAGLPASSNTGGGGGGGSGENGAGGAGGSGIVIIRYKA